MNIPQNINLADFYRFFWGKIGGKKSKKGQKRGIKKPFYVR